MNRVKIRQNGIKLIKELFLKNIIDIDIHHLFTKVSTLKVMIL